MLHYSETVWTQQTSLSYFKPENPMHSSESLLYVALNSLFEWFMEIFFFFLSPSWYFRSRLQLDCSSNTLNYDNLGKLQFQSSFSTLVSHGIPESVSTGAVSSELSLRYNYLCWTHHQDTQGLMGQDD